jgi:hypothetical protein
MMAAKVLRITLSPVGHQCPVHLSGEVIQICYGNRYAPGLEAFKLQEARRQKLSRGLCVSVPLWLILLCVSRCLCVLEIELRAELEEASL